jgi:hypothetical protein
MADGGFAETTDLFCNRNLDQSFKLLIRELLDRAGEVPAAGRAVTPAARQSPGLLSVRVLPVVTMAKDALDPIVSRTNPGCPAEGCG